MSISTTVKFDITSFEFTEKDSRSWFLLWVNKKQSEHLVSHFVNTPLPIEYDGTDRKCWYCRKKGYYNEYALCVRLQPNYIAPCFDDKQIFSINEKQNCKHQYETYSSKLCSIMITYKRTTNYAVSISHVQVLYKLRPLKKICAHILAKQIYSSELYLMYEKEMDSSKLLLLRDLERMVNRDIFTLVYQKIKKLRIRNYKKLKRNMIMS